MELRGLFMQLVADGVQVRELASRGQGVALGIFTFDRIMGGYSSALQGVHGADDFLGTWNGLSRPNAREPAECFMR